MLNKTFSKQIKIEKLNCLFKIVFCLAIWNFYLKKKSYAIIMHVGPLVVSATDLDKLNQHVKKTIKKSKS